ncbi:hypothetical protein M0802_008244 [Mischocyttarus mexicanus]|nr:hypothetical protein M0802_008244 [Mischocyttarus mexicanus]
MCDVGLDSTATTTPTPTKQLPSLYGGTTVLRRSYARNPRKEEEMICCFEFCRELGEITTEQQNFLPLYVAFCSNKIWSSSIQNSETKIATLVFSLI